MALSPLQRKIAQHSLAAIAVCCVVFTTVSLFLVLEAGTMQLDGDYPKGPARLILSSLSVVRFKGIVPAEGDGDYQVTLLWFINAFGWEWPTTTWELSCGIVHNINGFLPGPALTLPGDLGETGARLRLPESDWQCLGNRAHNGGLCQNEFLAAWDAANILPTSFRTAFALWLFYFTGVVLFAILLQEISIRWYPSMGRCMCPDFISKNGLCPCLKKNEKMTPDVRIRVRTWYLVLLAISYTTASTFLLLTGAGLVRFLKEMDSKVGGMDPQLGTAYVKLSAFTLIAILLSLVCLKVRYYLEQGRSWMEQQGVDATTLTESGLESQADEEADASLI